MTLDEALIIANRMEDEGVVGTLGMAIRVLLKEYQEVDRRLDQYEYKVTTWGNE